MLRPSEITETTCSKPLRLLSCFRPSLDTNGVDCGISPTLVVRYGDFHLLSPLTCSPIKVPKYADLSIARHERVLCGGPIASGFLGG